ncbi:hypothetical protein HMPREF0322_04871 [Desulfitobacterium hafniense DP7]|uniref:Uncharacterized protein n=1 Tax=Desulfitobacterium hafniense DP7 TaxID=537010 RepID=G9XV57_DESHA|nr:hypothetical protein HMPREF0322_04871 [Desulfitobacterium hafniense DP7]
MQFIMAIISLEQEFNSRIEAGDLVPAFLFEKGLNHGVCSQKI